MDDKKVLKCGKMIKKASVEFCPEVPQNFGGKNVTDKMLSLKFKEIKKWTEVLIFSILYYPDLALIYNM